MHNNKAKEAKLVVSDSDTTQTVGGAIQDVALCFSTPLHRLTLGCVDCCLCDGYITSSTMKQEQPH